MKSLFKLSLLLALFWLMGCNQSANTTDKSNAAMVTMEREDQADLPAYDPAMDLTLMAADAVEMFGDTLGIKMYIGTMAPGDSVGWHFHPDHTIYVLEGGTLAVYFNGSEEKQIMERAS